MDGEPEPPAGLRLRDGVTQPGEPPTVFFMPYVMYYDIYSITGCGRTTYVVVRSIGIMTIEPR